MRLLPAILLCISLSGFSQSKTNQVLVQEKAFGKYFPDSTDVKGLEYIFPDKIYRTILDSVTGCLTVQLRGTTFNGKYLKNSGKIIQYDIRNRELLWIRSIDYLNSHILQYGNTIIYTSGMVSYCLGVKTGSDRWKAQTFIFMLNSVKNIGLGYNKNDLMEGIDLKTGSSVWSRYLNNEFDLDDILYMNDSTLIFSDEGLHKFNIIDGLGWDYDAITTSYESSLMKPSGIYWGLSSNALIDSNYIYFASKERLVKLNKETGIIVWKIPLSGSKSSIFKENGIVFMINHGMAYFESDETILGNPFFAAFDQSSGKRIFFTPIEATDEYIVDFTTLNDDVFLLFPNRMMKYSITGEKIADNKFPLERYGVLKFFVRDDLYIKISDNDFQTIKEWDSTKLYIHTREENTFAIDAELKFSKRFKKNEVYLPQIKVKDFNIDTNGKKTVILNKDAKRIAETEAISYPFIQGNVLYGFIDSSFVAIDLSNLIDGSPPPNH